MAKDKFNYDQAIQEIEDILKAIEEGKMGVDELTEKVERVSQLLKKCREKLYLTESQVNNILSAEN
jgi:exodeoxyribonuclease VII small subunit